MTMSEEWVVPDFVRGDMTGLDIPAHADALSTAGPAFLTEAFRRFGSIAPDNEVTRITRFDPCPGGSTGHKLFLSVEYARDDPGLHRDLFVKFSRHLTNPFFERRRFELESEIHLAMLTRHPAFPVEVAAAYFADNHGPSGTGVLIQQRIPYGEGAIEPLKHKCMDHELDDPIAYYRAILSSQARLAGAYKAGRLSPEVDVHLTYDPQAAMKLDPFLWGEDGLRERIARYAAFAERCPQLLPAAISSPAFIAQMERDGLRVLEHSGAIMRFLHSDRDMVALCHWNSNIDNAFFHRDAEGKVHCGLIDWQRACPTNLAIGLFGGLCSMGHDIWANDLDAMLADFIAEYHAEGGPLLDLETLKLHLDVYAARMGIIGLLDTPGLVLSHLPEAVDATGPLDPMFERSESARSYLHIMTSFLNLWEQHDFGASLDRMLARMGVAA